MTNVSPIRSGFRAVWRQPALALAEIAWRWAWGAASLALAWFAALSFLESLHVSGRDELQLRSNVPQLVADALLHIFQGSGPTLLRLFFVIAPAVTVLWMMAASAGRAATLRALLPAAATDGHTLRRTFTLHFLRVLVGVIAFAGTVISFLLGSFAAAGSDQPEPALFILIFFPLALVFTILRSRINWFLFLANIYVMRAGSRVGAAMTAASSAFRARSGEFIGVGTVFGAIRAVLIGSTTFFSLVLLGALGSAPGWLIIGALAAIALGYFAISDWLYAAKLAAYVSIIEDASQPSAVSPHPVMSGPSLVTAPSSDPVRV